MKKIFCLIACAIVSTTSLSQTVVRKIKPSDTDPLISTFNTDSNYIYFNSTSTPKNVLVVHLPGSFGEPKRATLFGTLAADLGFHSIGLMYPNVPTVGSFCSNSSDADCFEDVRREIVEGIDYSSDVSISFNESILNRTKKLIVYLNTNYPSENWGQYIDSNGDIIFNKVIFSGHSQGGGHAALIAKYYPLKRAICFSSPKDWRNTTNKPPLWLSTGNWQTASSDIYAFNHVLDEHTNQLEIWDSLGLGSNGLPINVDSNSSPFSNTRQLITSYSVPAGDAHACTIQDNKTPKVSGIPVFTPVWTYMLTNNLTTGLSELPLARGSGLTISPNPAADFINIELPGTLYVVKIFDISGKCILEQLSKTSKLQMNIKTLNSGLYFVQVISDNKLLTTKMTKL